MFMRGRRGSGVAADSQFIIAINHASSAPLQHFCQSVTVRFSKLYVNDDVTTFVRKLGHDDH